ncbi:MAG: 50S ribosomal protein L19 [Chlamydiota bacterium]
MRQSELIDSVESEFITKEKAVFHIGDTVCVQVRIIEGDKERLQSFTGTVIARKGKGLSETFSLYRNAYNCCMERVFFLHSPRIAKIEVVRSGKVRRAKLYYVRGTSGKAAKVAAMERRASASVVAEEKLPANS